MVSDTFAAIEAAMDAYFESQRIKMDAFGKMTEIRSVPDKADRPQMDAWRQGQSQRS